jgi:hypothetical protein
VLACPLDAEARGRAVAGGGFTAVATGGSSGGSALAAMTGIDGADADGIAERAAGSVTLGVTFGSGSVSAGA